MAIFLVCFKRLTNYGVTLIGIVTIRREVIGLLPVATINLGGVHEAHHVDSVLCLQLQIVNLFGPEENVLPLAMLVAPNGSPLRHQR